MTFHVIDINTQEVLFEAQSNGAAIKFCRNIVRQAQEKRIQIPNNGLDIHIIENPRGTNEVINLTIQQDINGKYHLYDAERWYRRHAQAPRSSVVQAPRSSAAVQAQPASGVTVQQVIVKNNDVKKQDWWISHKNIFVRSDAELDAIEKYNNALPDHDTAHVIPIAFPFEGVVGNPQTAEIIVLSHNPHVPQNNLLHTLKVWLDVNQSNDESMPEMDYFWKAYQQQGVLFEHPEQFPNFPAYNFDRKFSVTYDYWKQLIGENSLFWDAFAQEGYAVNAQTQKKLEAWLAKHVAFVELFGYHSTKFDRALLRTNSFRHMKQCDKYLREIARRDKILFVAKDPHFYRNKLENYGVFQSANAFCVDRTAIPRPRFENGNIIKLWDYNGRENGGSQKHQEAADAAIISLRNLIRNSRSEIQEFLSKDKNLFDYESGYPKTEI